MFNHSRGGWYRRLAAFRCYPVRHVALLGGFFHAKVSQGTDTMCAETRRNDPKIKRHATRWCIVVYRVVSTIVAIKAQALTVMEFHGLEITLTRLAFQKQGVVSGNICYREPEIDLRVVMTWIILVAVHGDRSVPVR